MSEDTIPPLAVAFRCVNCGERHAEPFWFHDEPWCSACWTHPEVERQFARMGPQEFKARFEVFDDDDAIDPDNLCDEDHGEED